MHHYSTDASERIKAPFVIAVLSILIVMVVDAIFARFNIHIPWYVDKPSIFGLYLLFYGVYDQWLWKFNRWGIRFSAIPDLAGTWSGQIKTTFDPERIINAVISIEQTWSKIRIRLRTAESSSRSTTAAIFCRDHYEAGLHYSYVNDPKATVTETMVMHKGSARFELPEDGKTLQGKYDAGRGRSQSGDMNFQLVNVGFTQAIAKLEERAAKEAKD